MTILAPFITIIITLIVAGAIYWVVEQIPLPAPFPKFIQFVVIIAAVIYLLSALFGYKLIL